MWLNPQETEDLVTFTEEILENFIFWAMLHLKLQHILFMGVATSKLKIENTEKMLLGVNQ